jgi:hypothetical protein
MRDQARDLRLAELAAVALATRQIEIACRLYQSDLATAAARPELRFLVKA